MRSPPGVRFLPFTRSRLMARRRVLFLYPQSLGPEPEATRNAHFHLSSRLTGDLLYDWVRAPSDRERLLPLVQRSIGDFSFHYDADWEARSRFGGARAFQFYVSKGLQLVRERGPYDAIVAYGPFRTGLAGVWLRARTGTPLVVEIPGNHLRSYDFVGGRFATVKKRIAKPVLRFVTSQADLVRLLYPTQLDEVGRPPAERLAVFHNFVTVDGITPSRPREPYLLFMGYPFWLKGVDLLIKAFRAIADRHPRWKLRIVGHCPDPSPFLALAGGDPRISIEKALEHPEAMAVMERCGAFVLPSRTEAMGRVLLEAMAARRPIVASRVDGIPTYVSDGENGLLFNCGDADDLSRQLDRLLGDESLAERLAAEGHRRVHERYSVESYVDQFAEMIDRAAMARRPR